MSVLLMYRHGPIRLIVHAQGVVLLNCVTEFLVAEKDRSSASTIQTRSCSLRFPPLCSPQRCNPWEQVWEW